jgi:acyl-CoA thioesterase YciA
MPEKDFDNISQMPKELEGRIPTLRTIAMPADSNPFGDIFGGWLLSQMDLAGGAHAYKHIGQRVVTVGINGMTFHKPVFIGDEVSIYTRIQKKGVTSITIHIESWAFRRHGAEYAKVTEGLFTYVLIDENRHPVPISSVKR